MTWVPDLYGLSIYEYGFDFAEEKVKKTLTLHYSAELKNQSPDCSDFLVVY